ncbi:hypothetical protein TNCV_2653551 [Trichonephila clavipes]|nr:hypothetical protein TNCV_2653551 [Trichonephila clavipes]
MCRDRRGRQRYNRSKEPSPTGAEKGKTSEDNQEWIYKGSEKVRRERLRFEGCCCEPVTVIGVFRKSRCEAPPAKRLIFEGALVRSLPRKIEENREVCGIRIWSQRTLPTRWGIAESELRPYCGRECCDESYISFANPLC